MKDVQNYMDKVDIVAKENPEVFDVVLAEGLDESNDAIITRINVLMREQRKSFLIDFVSWLESNGLIDSDLDVNYDAFLDERKKK